MKEQLSQQIDQALRALLDEAGDNGPVPEFALDVPRQAEHGDFSCNAAMMLAKRLHRAPRAIAEDLSARLADPGGFLARVEIAGPGFVNMWLATRSWQGLLQEIIEQGARYGVSDIGHGRRVQVEFVSANPTGPLSVGHGRQAVLGDCIARLHEKCGFDVVREYYFNDGGRQMRVLGDSVKARYLEVLGKAAAPPADAMADPEKSWVDTCDGLPVVFPKDGYQGDYIRDIAARLIETHGDGLVDEPGEGRFREFAQAEIFEDINGTLKSIGVEFDVYFGERSLYEDGKLEQAIDALRENELIFDADGATWLASTKLDLDRDRVVIKSSGEPTYLMPDIAYHLDKYDRGFDLIIDVLGADHIEQFPFVRRAMGALGRDMDRLELVMHQFVTVTSGGKKVKQSTRKATFITVDELVEDVGVDVFRFFMVERKPEGHLDFDLDIAKDRNWRKNPAFYVQYAHARTHGIERKAAEAGVTMPAHEGFDPARLSLTEEIDIVKKLGEFPELVLRATETREPHHIAYYLRELAGLWNPYLQDGQQHRVISDDAALTAARLGLVLAVRSVLRSGLELLGLSAAERM
jgi:arginyl-tRNA synthetase